jgi:hypothetical protein
MCSNRFAFDEFDSVNIEDLDREANTGSLTTPNDFACAPRTARPVPSVLADSRPFFSQKSMICASSSSIWGSMVSISGA